MTENSYLFHTLSANRLGQKGLPFEQWPKEWKTTYYKRYPRLPRFLLRPSPSIKVPLGDSLKRRRSRRDFGEGAISFRQLSTLLWWGTGELNHHRPYPSGGARYPLEVYVLLLRPIEPLPRGLFHYSVQENALELLVDEDPRPRLSSLFRQRWSGRAAAIIIVTAVFHRSQIKYIDRGYRYILMESGHMMQNLVLIGAALRLRSCPLGGFYDEQLNDYLDVDGYHEATLITLPIGR